MMFSIRSTGLLWIIGLATCGCVARGPAHPEALNNTPLPADQAVQLRDWSQSTAYYPNGATVSGPTDYTFQVKRDEPEWTYYYADFGTWALNTGLLPYYLFAQPQWTQATSPGEVVQTTYTGQPPLPPQVLPGYVPRDIRPPAPAPATTSKPMTHPSTANAPLVTTTPSMPATTSPHPLMSAPVIRPRAATSTPATRPSSAPLNN